MPWGVKITYGIYRKDGNTNNQKFFSNFERKNDKQLQGSAFYHSEFNKRIDSGKSCFTFWFPVQD